MLVLRYIFWSVCRWNGRRDEHGEVLAGAFCVVLLLLMNLFSIMILIDQLFEGMLLSIGNEPRWAHVVLVAGAGGIGWVWFGKKSRRETIGATMKDLSRSRRRSLRIASSAYVVISLAVFFVLAWMRVEGIEG